MAAFIFFARVEIAATRASGILVEAAKTDDAAFFRARVETAKIFEIALRANEVRARIDVASGARRSDVERRVALVPRTCSVALFRSANAKVETASGARRETGVDLPPSQARVGTLGVGEATVEGIVKTAIGVTKKPVALAAAEI